MHSLSVVPLTPTVAIFLTASSTSSSSLSSPLKNLTMSGWGAHFSLNASTTAGWGQNTLSGAHETTCMYLGQFVRDSVANNLRKLSWITCAAVKISRLIVGAYPQWWHHRGWGPLRPWWGRNRRQRRTCEPLRLSPHDRLPPPPPNEEGDRDWPLQSGHSHSGLFSKCRMITCDLKQKFYCML